MIVIHLVLLNLITKCDQDKSTLILYFLVSDSSITHCNLGLQFYDQLSKAQIKGERLK